MKTLSALLFITSMVLCGCGNAAESTVPVTNKEFEVEKLFTDPNGYTVYRFRDSGVRHYYVTGPTSAQTLGYKTGDEDVHGIQTIRR